MKFAQKNAWGMTLVICLTIVISSVATATAAKMITGAQIRNSSITGADIKNGSITAADLAPGTAVSGARGSDGAAGANGSDGSDGADGATGATGAAGTARAYASVVTGDPPYFTPGKSKGFIGITHPNSGAYCLQLEPGINADEVAPVATVDYWASPNEVAFVEVHSGGNECEDDEIEIITRGSDGTSFADNVGFHVIVP
jgi:hypothetical protein